MHCIKNDFIREETKGDRHKGDQTRTRQTYTDTRRSEKLPRKTQGRTLTKLKMEGLSVLQAEVERLQERREELTTRIARIGQKMENEREWEEKTMSSSLAESAWRSRVALEEEERITKIREKIRKVDGQIWVWEERIERVREAGGRAEEDSEGVLDKFEGAINRASGRIEREQRMLEQMRAELSVMRGYM